MGVPKTSSAFKYQFFSRSVLRLPIPFRTKIGDQFDCFIFFHKKVFDNLTLGFKLVFSFIERRRSIIAQSQLSLLFPNRERLQHRKRSCHILPHFLLAYSENKRDQKSLFLSSSSSTASWIMDFCYIKYGVSITLQFIGSAFMFWLFFCLKDSQWIVRLVLGYAATNQ